MNTSIIFLGVILLIIIIIGMLVYKTQIENKSVSDGKNIINIIDNFNNMNETIDKIKNSVNSHDTTLNVFEKLNKEIDWDEPGIKERMATDDNVNRLLNATSISSLDARIGEAETEITNNGNVYKRNGNMGKLDNGIQVGNGNGNDTTINILAPYSDGVNITPTSLSMWGNNKQFGLGVKSNTLMYNSGWEHEFYSKFTNSNDFGTLQARISPNGLDVVGDIKSTGNIEGANGKFSTGLQVENGNDVALKVLSPLADGSTNSPTSLSLWNGDKTYGFGITGDTLIYNSGLKHEFYSKTTNDDTFGTLQVRINEIGLEAIEDIKAKDFYLGSENKYISTIFEDLRIRDTSLESRIASLETQVATLQSTMALKANLNNPTFTGKVDIRSADVFPLRIVKTDNVKTALTGFYTNDGTRYTALGSDANGNPWPGTNLGWLD